MIRAGRLLRASLLAVAGGLVGIAPLAAQSDALHGVAVDTAGEPLTDHVVVLHRVAEGGGAAIGRATTDASGRFTIPLPDDAPEGGVYFAALRYAGQLYIGATFRGPNPPTEAYRIIAGGVGGIAGLGPGVAGADVPGASQEVAADGAVWWAMGGTVTAALMLIAVGWRVQSRPPAVRRTLHDLATLEEQYAARGTAATEEERRAYQRERSALRARLRELART